MPKTLSDIAHAVLLDGAELARTGRTRTQYYERTLERKPSSIATATKGFGMSRSNDPVRALVTGDNGEGPALALGPSAGIVLGVSVASASIRAAAVDANGFTYHARSREPAKTLAATQTELFNLIKAITTDVLESAMQDEQLLVQGRLPFLGIAVAWPTPLDREKTPQGVFTHPSWTANKRGLHLRLAKHLGIDGKHSTASRPRQWCHAIPNAAATAMAAAFDYTRSEEYQQKELAKLLLVVRLSGRVSAATISVEPKKEANHARISGWMISRLTGGHKNLAGEFGHTPVNASTLKALKDRRTRSCPDFVPAACPCDPEQLSSDHLEVFAGGEGVGSTIPSRR